MIKKIFPFLIIFSATCLFNSCTSSKTVTEIKQDNPPKAMREFRAAWVATVANINWPSKPGLTTDQQQKEAIALLDFLQQHNFTRYGQMV
jgi:uncharacterized lipoprotein YddW (UPF0748 family)